MKKRQSTGGLVGKLKLLTSKNKQRRTMGVDFGVETDEQYFYEQSIDK
jgi:hypothetical protein